MFHDDDDHKQPLLAWGKNGNTRDTKSNLSYSWYGFQVCVLRLLNQVSIFQPISILECTKSGFQWFILKKYLKYKMNDTYSMTLFENLLKQIID